MNFYYRQIINEILFYFNPARRCYQPAPRVYHSTVAIGDNLYLWGKESLGTGTAQGRSLMSKIDIFNLLSAEWKEKQTKGSIKGNNNYYI